MSAPASAFDSSVRPAPTLPEVDTRHSPVAHIATSRHFPEVESLRGIAILLVMLHHANAFVTAGRQHSGEVVSLPWAFVAGGQTGVSLFFVLSGFLLSLPFLTERDGGRCVSRRRYFRNRAYRILPLYFTAILFGTLVLTGLGKAGPREALPYLIFANGVVPTHPLAPFSNVWWSLATEVQFYCVLPLVFALPSRRGWMPAVLGLYAVLLGYGLTAPLGLGIPSMIVLSLSLFGRGFMFVLGDLAAWVYLRHGQRIRRNMAELGLVGQSVADGAIAGLIAALAFLLRWQVFTDYWQLEGHLGHLWHVVEAALWTMILLVLLLTNGRMKSLFSNAVFARLGVLSYSLYLVHYPLMKYAVLWIRPAYPETLRGWSLASATIVALMLVAATTRSALTYRFIEQPFLRRKA